MLGCKIATSQITPKACMYSATCCGMESRRKPCMESSRSDAWNQSEGRCTLKRDAIRLRRLHTRLRRNYIITLVCVNKVGFNLAVCIQLSSTSMKRRISPEVAVLSIPFALCFNRLALSASMRTLSS